MKRATLLKPKSAKYWYGYGSALYRNIDCDFIAAAATYVRLCKSGSKCPEDQVAWAESALRHFSTDKECSVK